MCCAYCGKICVISNTRDKSVNAADSATLDHIVPQKELMIQALDDRDYFLRVRKDPKNLVLACGACNSSKQHDPLSVWCAKKNLDHGKIMVEIGSRISRS